MNFAYLVCFVALLQVSSCQDANSTEFSFTIAPTNASDPAFDPSSNDTSESVPTSGPITTTTDNTMVESQSYQSAGPETTTDLTTEESAEESTTKGPSGKGVLVYPTALVVLVPLCIRLATINLVGLV